MASGGGKLYYLPLARRSGAENDQSGIRIRAFRDGVPLFDALASAGSCIPVTAGKRAQLASAVSQFLVRAERELDEAIDADARRFKSGFYKYDDPGNREQSRQTVILCLAMHLVRNVELMWDGLQTRFDAGTASVFDTAFISISKLLDSGYYGKENRQIHEHFHSMKDLMDSALRLCGQESRVMGFQAAVESNVDMLVERTKQHFRALG
ncbi:MAG: hypothetical protein U0R44_03440 [Candidatus Micrarchaeia archaeon]